MGYSAKYIEHFTAPRGVGEIESPDLTSEVEHKGGGCFDRVKLMLKIEDKKIAEAKFKARACSGTIASCSALTEMITDIDLDTARELTSENLRDYLDGVPEKKYHSVDLAVEALQEAIK